MDWFQALTSIFTLLGAGIALIQVVSPKEISKIINSLVSFIKRLLPVLSSNAIRIIIFTLVGATLAVTILLLINFTFKNANSQNPNTPQASQYLTYQSNTDVHSFTTDLTWDASAIMQHSMSIKLDIQPNSNPSDISKLSQKFGSGYTFFIVAQLDTDSTTFTAEPKDQMQQPMDQGRFSFHWIATPLQSGDQAVDVVIKGVWISQSNNNKQIEYYLGSHTWHISVADNTQYFVFGQFNLAQILGYGGSVIVSVAFIQLVLTGIGSRKQAANQAVPSTTQPAATQPPPPQSLQSPVVQSTSNQPSATQPPTASNQQNTQQPVP